MEHSNPGHVRGPGPGRILSVVLPIVLLASCSGDGGTATAPVPVPTSVIISPSEAALESLDEMVHLTAEVKDQNGWAMADAIVSWSSSAPEVAIVDASGVVTAATNGTATVAATAGFASGTAAVTVAQVPVGPVVLVPDSASFGESARLLAPDSLLITKVGAAVLILPTGKDANGQALSSGAKVTWSSTHPAVATVDSSGLVTAVANGRANLTAVSGSASELAATFASGYASGKLSVRVSDVSVDVDRGTLSTFYEETGGNAWTNSENWLTDAPLEAWHGVAVDDDGRVTHLALPANGLVGTIPSELGHLAGLEALDLGLNSLTGPIPPELGNLPALERLSLLQNGLTGGIPPEIGNLASLEHLLLAQNGLNGRIPPELGNLTNLAMLTLAENGLTGAIPSEVGNLTNIERLYLHSNGLTGTIPPALGGLAGLRDLFLADNRLTGAIPPALRNLASLVTLTLADNGLSGGIPSELGDLAGLEGLYLQNNGLTGAVPPELGRLSNLRSLHLNNNPALSDSLPETFLALQALRVLYLDGTDVCISPDQKFQDWLKRMEQHRGRECVDERQVLLAIYKALDGPNWWRWNWHSSRPLEEWRGVRVDAYGRVEGLGIPLDARGSIPPELGKLAHLKRLSVTSDGVTGGIPPELGNLRNLEFLRLWGKFTGSIPSELGDLAHLRVFDVHGADFDLANIPSELGKLGNLTTFRLSHRSGSRPFRIPVEFGNLANLEILLIGAIGNWTLGDPYKSTTKWCPPTFWWNDLWYDFTGWTKHDGGSQELSKGLSAARTFDFGAQNESHVQMAPVAGHAEGVPPELGLTGGSIPSELGSLSKLRCLVLSNSLAAGGIPPALGNLADLRLLVLNGLHLTGGIPSELGRLTKVGVLDLSHNALTGGIPPGLGSAGVAASFDRSLTDARIRLTFNLLTGSVPWEQLWNPGCQTHQCTDLRVEISYNRLSGCVPWVEKSERRSLHNPQGEYGHSDNSYRLSQCPRGRASGVLSR